MGCEPQKAKPLRVAINPWPGYQLISLAKELNLYEELGVDVELVELLSNGEVNRVYELGYVDVATSTLTDLVNIRIDSDKEPVTFYVCDFSNGADVIISKQEFEDLPALRGKRIGADVEALDYIHLLSALEHYDMSIEDVTVVPMRQNSLLEAISSDRIDAAVTYPPVSKELLGEGSDWHRIFDSSMIPGVIIDTLIAEKDTLETRKEEILLFIEAIEAARMYAKQNYEESIRIMAEYSGLSEEDFIDSLAGVAMTPPKEQIKLLANKALLNGNVQKALALYGLRADFAKPEDMFTTDVLTSVTD